MDGGFLQGRSETSDALEIRVLGHEPGSGEEDSVDGDNYADISCKCMVTSIKGVSIRQRGEGKLKTVQKPLHTFAVDRR